MENICLDTDILIDFLRNKQYAIEFIESNELINNLATTYINLFELYYGAMLSSAKDLNIMAIEKLETKLRILNLSKESVKETGKILAGLETDGDLIDFRDALIGSIAKTEKFSIKTNNLKHFKKIKNLNIL